MPTRRDLLQTLPVTGAAFAVAGRLMLDDSPAAAQPAPDEPPAIVAAQPEISEQWLTLGSADPASPYRMLVTLTNRGAAVARIELNSPRFRNLEDQTGYLGHLAAQAAAA